MSRISADKLSINEIQKKLIQSQVKILLERIYSDIRQAHSINQKELTASLPIMFDIPNVSNKEAQTHIYYMILMDLKDSKYDVKIEWLETHVLFKIRWQKQEDSEKLKQMKDILLEHSEGKK